MIWKLAGSNTLSENVPFSAAAIAAQSHDRPPDEFTTAEQPLKVDCPDAVVDHRADSDPLPKFDNPNSPPMSGHPNADKKFLTYSRLGAAK